MSIFHHQATTFIPRSWQRAPMLAHGYIARDRIYAIYNEPARNWNAYYAPAYERKPAIRAMSQRTIIARDVRRRLPIAATIHYLSQLKMKRYLDAISASRNRL